MSGPRKQDEYHNGHQDGFEPVRPVDLAEINSFDALLRAYRDASFGARRLGEAADVFEEMVRNQDCGVVLTLSGAMTVADELGRLRNDRAELYSSHREHGSADDAWSGRSRRTQSFQIQAHHER